MTRDEFNKEISNIENYYFDSLSYEEKEKWYLKLHNLPLETIKKSKQYLFKKSNKICSLNDFLIVCRFNFTISNAQIIDYMKEKGFFNSDEIERKARYYVKNKKIPMWLESSIEKYKMMYFNELIKGE